MTRQPESYLIVGAQKSGKTTLADKIIQSIPRKALIVDSDGREKAWFKYPVVGPDDIGKIRGDSARHRIIFDEDDPLFFRRIREQFTGGVLVFDDAAFFLLDRRAEHFRKILMKNRQTNNDVIWICHGLSEIPPSFWTFFSRLILFRTTDSFERMSRNYPNYEVMRDRVIAVNKMAEKNQYTYKVYQLR